MLHSAKELDLCKYSDANALLLVNTASFCGFTHQFSGLEELHNAYAERGLVVIGFPSNDFRQEAQQETETAKVCYINYGVTFDMVSPVSVKGDSVHPLFQALAEKSQSPGWNFNKYLVDPETLSVIHFGSRVDPGDEAFRRAIEEML